MVSMNSIYRWGETRAKAERITLETHVQFGCSRHRDDISTGGSLEGKTRSEDK